MSETKLDPLVLELIEFGISLLHHSRYFSRPSEVLARSLHQTVNAVRSKFDPRSHTFFRARLHRPRMKKPDRTFREREMLAPPLELASAGRLNCAGISRLYLASTRETAAAEVRAVTGDYVSITEFISKTSLDIFDFRNCETRCHQNLVGLASYIVRLITTPTDGYENYETILCQWIVEFMSALGVHAVIYPSVMRGKERETQPNIYRQIKGLAPQEFYNMCVFYPSAFKPKRGSTRLLRVHELDLELVDDSFVTKLMALKKIEQNPETVFEKFTIPPAEVLDSSKKES